MILILAVCGLPAAGQDASCGSLDDVAWMEGRWVDEQPGRHTIEEWSRVSDLTMEGIGYLMRPSTGEVRVSETLRLVEMSEEVFFVAYIKSNRMPVPFRLAECGSDFAVFENMAHDFPRRLAYTLNGADSLHVDVSDGEGNGFELSFVKREAPE